MPTSTNIKKSVCFISLDAYPLFNTEVDATVGGAEIQLHSLATSLANLKGFDVSFIVGDFDQPKLENYNNVKVYKLLCFNRFLPTFLTRIIQVFMLAILMKKIDSDVYIHRTASVLTGIICMFAKLFGKHFIFMTAHEWDCNGIFEKKSGKFKGQIFQYGLRNANLVITQSRKHQSLIKRYHSKNSIVMNSMYKIKEENALLNNKKNTVLWVARCEDWKRPEVFIELAKKFPKENFVMICPRSLNQMDYFHIILDKASTVSNLEFIKFVPFSKIDTYFRDAKIFVQTSVFEGFPNTFIQAAKNMTPILSLSVNPDNLLGENDCGICANNDEKMLIRSLKRLLKDDSLRCRMGSNAYAYALKSHDIDKIVLRYRDLFMSI